MPVDRAKTYLLDRSRAPRVPVLRVTSGSHRLLHRIYQPTRRLLSILRTVTVTVQLPEGSCVVDEETPGSILLLAKNNRSAKSQRIRGAARTGLP